MSVDARGGAICEVCEVCDCCGATFKNFERHLQQNPDCLPALVEVDSDTDDEEDLPLELATQPVISEHGLQGRIAFDLLTMRQEFGLTEANVRLLKDLVQGWHDEAQLELAGQLAGHTKGAGAMSILDAASRRSLFAGIATEKSELSRSKRDIPYLEPREATLSDEAGDVVVSFRVADLLQRKLQHDSAFRRAVIERSDYYTAGTDFQKPPTELADVADGVQARYHPELMRPAQPGEEHHVRLAGIFNCDDVEVRACFELRLPVCLLTLSDSLATGLRSARRRAGEAQAVRMSTRVRVSSSRGEVQTREHYAADPLAR
jgi:hypothetical protein